MSTFTLNIYILKKKQLKVDEKLLLKNILIAKVSNP